MLSKVVAVGLICLLTVKTVRSQSDELLVQGATGNLYLQHTVVAKENWYSIGRLYNSNPKELAPYNKLAMTQPLSIGQELLIPLTPVNFSQNGLKAAGESLVPLYHVIQEKEWMYRISVNHNKVPITNLEKWNNITKDQVHAGMHLIVGYLKVKTALSALANKAAAPLAVTTPATVAGKTTAPTGEKPVTVGEPGAVGEKTGAKTPADNAKTVGTKMRDTTVKTHDVVKTEKPVTPPVTPVNTAVNTPAGGSGSSVVTNTTPAPMKPVSASGKSFNGGFFKSDFSDGGKSAAGQAGIFKSTSGWQDGKYYALMNNIPVGTIVKVTLSSTSKTIYAKILGQLPDMKESAGLSIRISNAAASELGEADGKFNVDIRY